jgi:hypothetical protein
MIGDETFTTPMEEVRNVFITRANSTLILKTWYHIPYNYMKSLVPKRYISIFVYLRKRQANFGIYWEMH